MGSFENYLSAKGMTASSIASYSKGIKPLLEWKQSRNMEWEQLTYQDLMDYLGYVNTMQVAKSTIHFYIISARHFLHHLKNDGIIKNLTLDGFEIRGIPKKTKSLHLISFEELEQLYDKYHVPTSTGIRNKVIIGLLIYQGLSSNDLSLLMVDHVDLKKGRVHVPASARANARDLMLQSKQVIVMHEYIHYHRNQLLEHSDRITHQLIISRYGGGQLNNVLTALMKDITTINTKITSLSHIRSSVIHYWLSDANIRKVQYMAGHKHVSSTEKYLTESLDRLKDDLGRYHPMG